MVCVWNWNKKKRGGGAKFLLKKLTVFHEPFYEPKKEKPKTNEIYQRDQGMCLEHTRSVVSRQGS